jgi:hypothetical protein
MLALYGSIAVLGQGLHVLPGLGHDCLGEHGEDASHFHGATASVFSSDRPGVRAADGEHHLSCGKDCPICQYFAQAKSFLVLGGVASEPLPVSAHFTSLPLCFSLNSLSAYQSRGPPAA